MKILKQLSANGMKKLDQYSKVVLSLMTILWFLGAIYGGIVVLAEVAALYITSAYSVTVHLPELLTYIGGVMSTGVIGYYIKAAFENKEKIKQNPNYNEKGSVYGEKSGG